MGGGSAVSGSLGGVGVWLGVEESCRKCADASDDDADATLPMDELGVELEGPVWEDDFEFPAESPPKLLTVLVLASG